MSAAASTDDGSWCVLGAQVTEALPGAEAVCGTPLLDLVRAATARDPAAIAVTGQTASLSYADLLRLALNVAGVVTARVRMGQAVACMPPRHPNGIAALLGCLFTGRPCIVLDPADPADRREALLRDAAPALLLTSEPIATEHPVLTLTDALRGADQPWRPDQPWDADAPFVVHFTSGSTGRPKGIVLSARSALYRGLVAVESMGVTWESRQIHPDLPVASGGFAAMLGVLVRGGRLVVTDLMMEGAGAVLGLMRREAVTHASIPPAMLRMMFQLQRARAAFASMRVLRIGSSGLPWADVKAWHKLLPPDCAVIHSFASTEALNMAWWVVPPDGDGDDIWVPAGRLHLCHEYALWDADGQPVPAGSAGELVLRGRYVALGEWRDGHLVPGRMMPVPDRPGWRLFRTGDIVRVGADGLLRVLGRADRQVKINGVLVHPAEIEAVLRAEPGVSDAAVVARITSSGTTLHGFIATAEVDAAELLASARRRLANSLPMAFRPSRLTVLGQLPLLPAGKIDLVALTRLANE